VITLQHISIGYRPDAPLVKEANLHAREGELVALAGRNGSGKSTLLRSILGLTPLLEGYCLYRNTPVSSMDALTRARAVSYVSPGVDPQTSLRVRELVSLGRIPYTGWLGRPGHRDREVVDRALKEVGMESFADRRLDRLSDGERQRVMIARAVAQDTPVMILDEPSAYLDIPNKYEMVRILSTYRDRGKTIIYSTHDLETAMMSADKFWVIEGGRILEGSPEDLGLDGVYENLFASPGIRFDPETGKFRYRTASRGEVSLEGPENRVLYWTRHTLERIGFHLADEGARVQVNTVTGGGKQKWVIRTAEGERTAQSLYELASFLTHEG
jgi:iron complex transport system ATP-binding protein